jgi:hypothetical protein
MLNMPSPTEDLSTHSDGSPFVLVLREAKILAKPLKSLETPEPIPNAKGSLSSDQLQEIAKHRRPPSAWYQGDEEQIF